MPESTIFPQSGTKNLVAAQECSICVLIGYLRKEGEGKLLYTVHCTVLYIRTYYMEGLSKTKNMLDIIYVSIYAQSLSTSAS